MKALIKDTYSLLDKINQTLSPVGEWAVINIATNLPPNPATPFYIELPQVYLYSLPSVPTFLEEQGVIEAKLQNRYATGDFADQRHFQMGDIDELTKKAREKGWAIDDQHFGYFHKYSSCSSDFGPPISGLYSVLINKRRLEEFLRCYSNNLPKFNENTGELEFVGEKIVFKGKKQIAEVSLLVKNCNSLVSKKEFHEARSGGNYENDVAKDGSINEDLKKAYEAIKDKICANQKLKNSLILTLQEGFGMFVNQRIFNKIPDEEKTKLPTETPLAPQQIAI